LRLLAVSLLFAITSSVAQADRVMVFAAASLKNALDEIGASFEKKYAHTVAFNFAGSSQIARQVIAGAPADLLVTANVLWMNEAAKAGAIDLDSRFDLASNQLVLASTQEQTITLDHANLKKSLSGGRIAMALVDAVPAGMYGKQAFKYLDLWDSLRTSVVQADNVRSALRFLTLGETPLGVVYRSDAISDPQAFIAATFPKESHPDILYPVALTQKGADSEASVLFQTYLKGQDAQAILTRHGFEPVLGERG
jgi:molybdate transport system substrate-binding protein